MAAYTAFPSLHLYFDMGRRLMFLVTATTNDAVRTRGQRLSHMSFGTAMWLSQPSDG